MKYELRYDGIVEQSDDFDVLKKKSLLLQSEYVIYRVLQSSMNDGWTSEAKDVLLDLKEFMKKHQLGDINKKLDIK